MVRGVAYCCVLIAVSGLLPSTLAFFRFAGPPVQQPGGFGVMLPLQDGNPHDVGQFWNVFHSRMQQMEQAAQQNAASLEGLLRRWIPDGPPPPIPGTPLDMPKEPDFEDREALEESGEDGADVPFPSSHLLGGHDEHEDGPEDGEFGALGHGLFHVLGFPGAGTNFRQPWWQGPNVCVTREEVEEGDKEDKDEGRQFSVMSSSTFVVDDGEGGSYRFSTCQQSPNKYVCTTVEKENGVKKTHVVRHQCCHGYRRTRDTGVCTKMNLKDVVATAQDLGAAMFAQSMEASGVDMRALRRRNVTLFAPSDAAMQGYNSELNEQNEVEVYRHELSRRAAPETEPEGAEEEEDNNVVPVMMNSLKQMVLSHLVPGLIDLREAVNEQILFSENEQNSSIRINVFPGATPLVTANCVPVRAEAAAENGAVVMVDRVLVPVTRTLATLIEDNPQLSTFKKILEKSGLLEKLGQAGHWTAFAPTDAAFERLPAGMLSRLLEGEACLDNVARHHIVGHTLCSACVRGEVSTTSLAGETLLMTRGQGQGQVEGSDGEVHVDSAVMTKSDVTATNGVLHLLDAVLMPQSARSLSQALADRGLESLVRALAARSMLEELDTLRNVTLFAPSEAAMKKLKDEEGPSRDTLLYHVVHSEVGSCDFENNLVLKSQLQDATLRLNLFQTMPTFGVGPVRGTVQCARIVNVDELACGAVLHELDRVVAPPAGDLIAVLEKKGGFSTLLELIKGTRYEERLKQHESPLSLLAPTDEAFERMPAEQLEKLRADKDLREHVISKHVLTDVLCCDAVATPNWPFTHHVGTDYGTRLPLRRGPGGELLVGPLVLKTCDIMATNGVVHAVDSVRAAGGVSRRGGVSIRSPNNPNVNVELFGL